MDTEPFAKPGFSWKRHFTTVTPFSKYLALALFVALPFIGFFIGVKYESVRITVYEPTIVERVFEKEVVVESAGTSTPEVKIIIFSGTVREGGQTSCVVDGVCSTLVSEYEVTWAKGDTDEVRGTKDAVFPGDRVEVFGRVISEGVVTLYGNENYYLKKEEKQPTKKEQNQGLNKILRGELFVYLSDGPGCDEDDDGRMCFKETKVFTNSAWEYRDWVGVYDEGWLEDGRVGELTLEVSSTDLASLSENDPCEMSEDPFGIFTFYTEMGVINLDECQISKSNAPLFRETIADLLEDINNEIAS